MSYWCEVLAEGPVYGTGLETPYVLRAFQTSSPLLALLWLRSQALHLADRIDPDPQRSAWVRPFMRMPVPAVPGPDGPTELRFWCADLGEQYAASERIRRGAPLLVAVSEADCRYTLSVRPAKNQAITNDQ